jgi:putative peptide zinc metalloprotease protein
VEKGQPIARLSGRQHLAELGKVDAEIEEKQAKLRLLTLGPSPEEIDLAKKELEIAETTRDYARKEYEEAERMQEVRVLKAKGSLAGADDQLQFARNDLNRFKRLFEEGLVSRRQLEEAEERASLREKERLTVAAEFTMVSTDKLAGLAKGLAIAEEEANEARLKLQTLLAGSRREAIDAARAEVARVDAARRYLHDELRLIRVASPATGTVTTSKPKEKIGQRVMRGDLIVEVYELKKLLVEISVSEKEISAVEVGQNVSLRARALPGSSFAGVVTAIASTATELLNKGGTKVVIVTTEVDNTANSLKPGMTGNAKISGGTRPIMTLLTRRAAHFFRVEFWSWW